MNSFSELTAREKTMERLRWICVLPAAVLGGFAAQTIAGLVNRLAVYGWGTAAESTLVYGLQLLMFYVLKCAVFIVAAAKMAPRGRLATAIVLAAAAILMSLVVHVLGQPHPGVVNYTHFTAESAGTVIGVAYVFYSEKARSRDENRGVLATGDRTPRAEGADNDRQSS